MDETGQGKGPAAFPTETAGNGSKQPSPEEEQSSATSPITVEPSAQLSVRRFTGPRTQEGKDNSKHNALRHGIFSEVTVLAGESSDEYGSLLEGLTEALQPENELEKLLVEKLAMLSWRYRRLLQAEGAEIQQGSEFLEWDQRMQRKHEAEMAKRRMPRETESYIQKLCLIPDIQNPEILEYCLTLLLELQNGIRSQGFDEKRDLSILGIIYGGNVNLRGTLINSYSGWLNTSRVPAEERQRKGNATPERCKDQMLSEIDAEIGRLRDYREEQAGMELERTKLEILRRKVPESEKLDRLLRYETSLERAFDRALSQLERMQRLRRGQPIAPRIDVNVST
jgi:hypothetical protein